MSLTTRSRSRIKRRPSQFFLKLLCIAGCCAAFSSEAQATDPPCCNAGTWDVVQAELQVEWYFVPNQREIVAVPSTAVALAVAYKLGFATCMSSLPLPYCCPEAEFEFESDIDADSLDVWPSYAIIASAYAPSYAGRCESIGVATPTYGRIRSMNRTSVLDIVTHAQITDPLSWKPQGTLTQLDLGLAAAAVVQEWELGELPENGVDFDFWVSVDYSRSTTSTSQNCDEGDPPALTLTTFGITFIKVKVVITNSDLSTNEEIISGVYGRGDDDAPAQLGIFDSSEFDESEISNGVTVDATDVAVPISLSLTDAIRVELAASVDQFDRFDGDLSPTDDAADRANWDDRRMFISLLGTALNDDAYTPRADLDLDGDIDMEDYPEYVAVFNEFACTADFDANGLVETADIFAFLSSQMSGALAGDFDGSGLVETADIFAFLSAWFAGCV